MFAQQAPPAVPRLPVRPFLTAFGVLLGCWSVSQVLVVIGLVRGLTTVLDPATRTVPDEAALSSLAWFNDIVSLVNTPLTFVTFAVWLAWLLHARLNSEELHPARHRYAPGWAIGSWFVPVLWFWYPKQIVDDVWRASDPVSRVAAARKPALTTVWWVSWWVAFGAQLFAALWSLSILGLIGSEQYTMLFPTYAVVLVVTMLAEGVMVLAGALMFLIARRITAFQHQVGHPPGARPVPVAPGI